MPNYCDTNCIITGPDAEIERFKRECFVVDGGTDFTGIDFTRAEWKADTMIVYSTYQLHNGEHWLWIRSGRRTPIVDALTKISVLFPDLTFDTSIWGEFGDFATRGHDQGWRCRSARGR